MTDEIKRLQAGLKAAEDNLMVVSLSDDFAFTNGSWDAAKAVRDRYAGQLSAAEARRAARGQRMVHRD